MAYQRGELAKNILKIIAGGGILFILMAAPGTAIGIKYILDKLNKSSEVNKWSKKFNTRKRNFINSIIYLKRSQLIEFKEIDKAIRIVLSDKGEKRILNYQLEEMELDVLKKWDRYWRLIIFDIPEKKKIAREALRSKLKALGMIELQKSCYLWPYECKNEIDFISEVFEVREYIHYMVIKSFESEKLFKKHFNL